jgi:Ankyrin repeats (3 copies)
MTLLEARPEHRSVNDTLGLVVSGRVPRECKVQIPLLQLLCTYGADPNFALQAAALHGEFEAVHQLIRLGAKPDLAILAALGRTEEFLSHLPLSDSGQRHLALALAAQYGQAEIVRALLDAGEDPNRYNPPGAHSHSTPLHQAALAGHLGVVKLLVEREARLDIKDAMWQGTPTDWAQHEGRTAVETYLRERFEVWLLSGVLFGAAVHLWMNRIVIPLSGAAIPFSAKAFLTQLVIHILFVGVPIALVVSHLSR